MARALRAAPILVSQLVLLFAFYVAGNRLLSVCLYLSSPAACLGRMVCFNGIIGVSVGVLAIDSYLGFKPAKSSTIWLFVAAVIIIDALAISHMTITFCS
jgi:hypothetical protein